MFHKPSIHWFIHLFILNTLFLGSFPVTQCIKDQAFSWQRWDGGCGCETGSIPGGGTSTCHGGIPHPPQVKTTTTKIILQPSTYKNIELKFGKENDCSRTMSESRRHHIHQLLRSMQPFPRVPFSDIPWRLVAWWALSQKSPDAPRMGRVPKGTLSLFQPPSVLSQIPSLHRGLRGPNLPTFSPGSSSSVSCLTLSLCIYF